MRELTYLYYALGAPLCKRVEALATDSFKRGLHPLHHGINARLLP